MATVLLPTVIKQLPPNEPTIHIEPPAILKPVEEPLDTPEPNDFITAEDNLLISYIKGEPVHELLVQQEPPSTMEFEESPAWFASSISCLSKWKDENKLLRYSHSQKTWIQAKINPAMDLAQKTHKQTLLYSLSSADWWRNGMHESRDWSIPTSILHQSPRRIVTIPPREFTHNQRLSQTCNASPFYLIMGYHPRTIPTVIPKTNVPAVEQCLSELQKVWEEALTMHKLARQWMLECITCKFTPFKKGQKVWLDSKNLWFLTDHKKLAMKQQGPFTIMEVLEPLTYWLQLLNQWKIHPIFHAFLLTPFLKNEVHGPNYMLPPPDLIEGEEEYQVEAITNHQKHYGRMQFLVKWKGYLVSGNMWEPQGNLNNAAKLLTKYKQTHKIW